MASEHSSRTNSENTYTTLEHGHLNLGTLLLDGDILVYRFGFSVSPGSPLSFVTSRLHEFLSDLLLYRFPNASAYSGWLSGKGNFRYEVDPLYKANRKDAKKPEHYEEIRNWLVTEWGFHVTDGIEADDALAIEATELGDDCVIVSTDKDLNQVPGWHYNFVKKELYYVATAEGLNNFYLQLLTGDRSDNVVGVRGIGPVRASRLLSGCDREQEKYAAVVAAYEGDHARVNRNGLLLWLQRESGQMWSPPA